MYADFPIPVPLLLLHSSSPMPHLFLYSTVDIQLRWTKCECVNKWVEPKNAYLCVCVWLCTFGICAYEKFAELPVANEIFKCNFGALSKIKLINSGENVLIRLYKIYGWHASRAVCPQRYIKTGILGHKKYSILFWSVIVRAYILKGTNCKSSFKSFPFFKAIELQVQQPENSDCTELELSLTRWLKRKRQKRKRKRLPSEYAVLHKSWRATTAEPISSTRFLQQPNPLKYACVSAMPKSSCSCSAKRYRRYKDKG